MGAAIASLAGRLGGEAVAEQCAAAAARSAPTPTAKPAALPRRPPPSHDISVDDEPEFDVREHDWRFNLKHSG